MRRVSCFYLRCILESRCSSQREARHFNAPRLVSTASLWTLQECLHVVVADQQAVCGLIILFVIIASWLVPVLGSFTSFRLCSLRLRIITYLVLGYSCGLAYLVYRLSKVPPAIQDDVEKQDTETIPETIPSQTKQQKFMSHQSFQSTHRSHASFGYAI